MDGVAVFAQSDGATGAGPIAVRLDGVIKGGTGTQGAGIVLDGGSDNEIALGRNSFLFALNNRAMIGSDGNDAVVSSGHVVGNIDLGGGTNSFTNEEAGVLITNDTLNLGGGLLTNAGMLSPGGEVAVSGLGPSARRADLAVTENAVQTTNLDGSIVMTESSRFLVDVSFRRDGQPGIGSDLINATGSATVDGTVQPTLLALERALPLTLIETGGTSADNGALVIDTPVVDFEIVLGSIQLVANADFSLPGMTRNQREVGDHINSILDTDGSPDLGTLFAFIGNETDPDEVVDIIDRLTTEGYAANRVGTLFSGLGFTRAMNECESRMPAGLDVPPGDCWWLSSEGTDFELDPFDGFRRLESDSYAVIGGVDRAIDGITTVKFAAGYENLQLTSGDFFSSEADRYHLGVGIERHEGPWSLGAALTGSFGLFENERFVGASGVLPNGDAFSLDTGRSTQRVTQANLGLRAAYTFATADDRYYATPSFSLDASYILSEDSRESGLGAAGMENGETRDWVLSASPSVEVGGRFGMGNGTSFSPYLRGGFTLFSEDEMTIDSSFIGAPASAGRFENLAGFDRLYGRVSAGFVLESENRRSSLELGYRGAFSEHSTYHGAAATLSVRF
jgi:hypothetical protein